MCKEKSPGSVPKLVYLATRNAALTRQEFRARWRGHFKLASGLPRWVNVLRYAQCDVVTEANADAPVAGPYDGVAMIWWKSAEAHARHFGDTSSQGIMEADEDEVFFERVVNFALLTHETVFLDGAREQFKLVSFLSRAPDASRAEFVAYCKDQYAAAVLATPRGTDRPSRYVQNHDVATERRTTGLPYEMVDELSFTSVDAARHYCGNVIYRPNFAMSPAVIGRFSVLTAEHILYDVSGQDA
jgi:hypothetical protein